MYDSIERGAADECKPLTGRRPRTFTLTHLLVACGAVCVCAIGATTVVNTHLVNREKAAKQTITAAEQTEEFVADNAIIDVGLALAPETGGLSIVAALGATVVHNMAVSHFAAELKDEASAGIAKVESWLKRIF